MSSLIALKHPSSAEPLPAAHPGASADRALQRVWFGLLQTPWTSVAVVPADSSVATRHLVESLVAIGQQHGARLVRLLDTTGAQLSDVQRFTAALKLAGETSCVVLRTDAVSDNPTALALARAASRVLVVAQVGESRLPAVDALVNEIGRDRVLGCVLVK